MLAEFEDRVLVGRQGGFPPGFFSALAGFVEPGESLEEAVARELFEEAGIQVSDVSYVASQRSEEHTSELQSLMRISYAVFCLKKQKKTYNVYKCVRVTIPSCFIIDQLNVHNDNITKYIIIC